MAIAAKYAGKCARCGMNYQAGTMIDRWEGAGWVVVDCSKCAKEDRARATIRELEQRMLEKHNLALGCWGVPDGSRWTYTRGEYLRECIKTGDITDEERELFEWYYRGLMQRDLSD